MISEALEARAEKLRQVASPGLLHAGAAIRRIDRAPPRIRSAPPAHRKRPADPRRGSCSKVTVMSLSARLVIALVAGRRRHGPSFSSSSRRSKTTCRPWPGLTRPPIRRASRAPTILGWMGRLKAAHDDGDWALAAIGARQRGHLLKSETETRCDAERRGVEAPKTSRSQIHRKPMTPSKMSSPTTRSGLETARRPHAGQADPRRRSRAEWHIAVRRRAAGERALSIHGQLAQIRPRHGSKIQIKLAKAT